MRKLIIGIVMLFILFLFTYTQSDIRVENVSKSYGMSLNSSVNKYSLTMSSVPGFPLYITCNNNSETELKLIVNCEGGSLFLWHEDGITENVGSKYNGKFETTTIYWSPVDENGMEADTPVNFSVSAYDVVLDKETNRIDGEMVLNDEKYYVKRIK